MKNMFHIRLKCGSGPDDNIRWKLFYECDNFIFYILQLWHTLYSIELSWTIKTTTTTTVKRLTIYIESPYCFYLYYAVCSNAVCTGIEPFHKTKYECTFCKCSKQTDDRVGYLHLNKTQYTQSVRWSRNKTTKYAELLTYYFVNCIDIFFFVVVSCGGICALARAIHLLLLCLVNFFSSIPSRARVCVCLLNWWIFRAQMKLRALTRISFS